ncbi:MAG TPA: ATP-binding protein [Burkholderiales bacterium]|nr:ATP-binding protein [Burkholderiales bacterium]
MKPVEALIAQNREIRSVQSGRLFRRYFLLVLGLVCGALLISGAIGVYFSYQENKVALSSVQREKAVGAAARIEDFVRQIERQLRYTEQMQLIARNPEQLGIEFSRLQKNVPAITDVALIGANGRERMLVSLLGMNSVDSGLDRSGDAAFKGARPQETWFGPVYFRKETEPYMAIALRSRAGAVTVADVNLKFMWDVVTRIKIGRKGKAYVVDGTGHLVADPDIGLVLRKTDLSRLPQVEFALKKGSEESFALMAQDAAGSPVLTAYASIEPLGWKVFVEQPAAEVYETLNAAILRTVSLIVAGLLFSALAAMWLARSMVRPIRTLQEGAARIGAGDLEQRIEVKTGDELQALANEFNHMAVRLQESYAGLERKVEKRTLELTEALEHQTATAEILKVISSSTTDTQPVFEAIVQSGARLFSPCNAAIIMREGDWLQRKTRAGPAAFDAETVASLFPVAFDPAKSPMSLAIAERRVVEISDTQGAAQPEHVRRMGAAANMGSVALVPLVRDGEGIGVLALSHPEPGFQLADKHKKLLRTFADQAVIAIENVRLFNEIQDKGRQLEIANQHKSEFLANMSHELRTPLNAVIGFSEVLMEKMFGDVNEKQLDYLNDIHSSGKHLLSLINDILDLSKIEAGRMELDLAEFDLGGALANAMTLVKERAQRNGVELALEADPALGAFRADERKFKQIMLNLLSNAVKFTSSGGNITVRARPVAGGLEVAVADTGVGIAPEDQGAVFEAFRQVGRDYTKKAEGTGLGLALVRKFVELHGGAIRLESEIGKGSTFTFTLPERA